MSDSEGKQVGGKRRFNEGIVSRSPEGAPLTVSGVESSFEYGTFDRWHPPLPLSAAGIIVMQCSAVTRTLRSLGRRKGLGTGARARSLPPSLSDSGPPSCLRFCLRCRLAAGGKCLALRLPYLRKVDINEYCFFYEMRNVVLRRRRVWSRLPLVLGRSGGERAAEGA